MSIQTLRDKSEGIVAKILIGLIVLVFALFGFGQITTFLSPAPRVATVDGEKITQQEMDIAVERNRRLLLAQNKSPSEINEDQLRKTVLQNLINRKLLGQAADKLGLYFGDKSLDEEIVKQQVFQVDGKFDAGRFQQVIGGAGYTPLSYRNEMSTDKRLEQLVKGIEGSAFLTSNEVARSGSLAQQTRDVAFLRISVDALKAGVDVTDDEVKDYYSNHPARFMTPETVKLAYIELSAKDLMDKVVVTDEDLKKYYEQTKSNYTEEESRRVAHILIETNGKVSDAEAKAKIDDIHKQIENGASFAEMARRYSQDPGSAKKGGDLGFNSRGSFVKAFDDVAFSLKPNQISKPVKTEFGYHIIKLLDIEPQRVPGFAEVRDKVEENYRKEKAEEMFVKKSGKLSELAFESPDLKRPAEELGLEIKTTGYLSRDAKTGIAADDGVMKAAFGPDVLNDGNNSSAIEVSQDDHIVLRVADHKPQALKPLAEVGSTVRDLLKKEKAGKLAETQAKDIVDMLKKGSIARFVADKYGLAWKVFAGAKRNQTDMDRTINQEAFKLARPPKGGKSVGYAMLANGDAAVISVTNVKNEPEDKVAATDVASMQRLLSAQEGGYEFLEFRDQLAREGDITTTK